MYTCSYVFVCHIIYCMYVLCMLMQLVKALNVVIIMTQLAVTLAYALFGRIM